MVKRGPCFHCGVTNTPLWRNGPAEKPVLCNACGSRYKSRGTLHNYLPKNVQFKFLLINDNDDTNLLNDDDYKDSQLEGGGNDNDNTNNKDLLTSKIPSKKRSRVEYMEAPESAPARAMKKFHKELLSLYRKSNPDEFLPEDGTLIEDNVNNFIPPNEIGHGAILFKPPPPADDDNNEGSSTITSNN